MGLMMTKVLLSMILFMSMTAVATGGRSLRIVSLAQAPYTIEQHGKTEGVLFELGNALSLEAGLTPLNQPLRLARAVEEISSGRADMVIMLPTREIEEVARNLGPLLIVESVALGSKGVVFDSIDNLRGKKVASLRAAVYDKRISEENGIKIYPTKDYVHGLKLLLAKRVDAVVGPRVGLEYAIKSNGLDRERFGEPLVLGANPVCVFLSKGIGWKTVEQLRAALGRLKGSGAVARIVTRYVQ